MPIQKPFEEKRGRYAGKKSPPLPAGVFPGTTSHAQRRSVPVDRPLTEMQRRLVVALAEGNNLTSASVRAEYSTPSAAKLALAQPNVKAALAREREKYAEASNMTRKKVMDGFLEAIDMAKLMAEPATMVSGWREIAKMCGYMEPVKRQIDVNITGNLALERINQLSDAELLKLITQDVVTQVEAIAHDEDEATDVEFHTPAGEDPQ